MISLLWVLAICAALFSYKSQQAGVNWYGTEKKAHLTSILALILTVLGDFSNGFDAKMSEHNFLHPIRGCERERL